MNLTKSILIYGISSSLSKFIGVFLVPIYSIYFSQEEYGALDLVQTVILFASIFGMMQLESAISRYYYEVTGEDRVTYISTAFNVVIIFSVFFSVLVFFSSNYLSNFFFDSDDLSYVFQFSAINILLFNIFGFLSVLIRFLNRPLLYSIIVFIQFTLTGLISIVLLIYFEQGILSFFIGQSFGLFTGSVILYVKLKKDLTFRIDKLALISMFKYSLPQVPSTAGNWLNTYSNRFIMLSYLSVAEIGIYTVALQISSAFKILDSAFRMAWLPYIFEKVKKGIHKILLKKLLISLSLTVFFLCILFSLFAEEIQSILSTNEYIETIDLIKILVFSFSFSIINQVVGIGINIEKKTGYLTIAFFVGLIINIGFMFFLVPIYKLFGVAASLLISNISIFIILWFFAEKEHYIGYSKLKMICIFLITSIIMLTLINFNFNFKDKIIASVFILINLLLFQKRIAKIFRL
mgnify:CR=1 FL=1